MKLDVLDSQTAVAALVVSVFCLSGCIEYTIETTLDEDGSGVRREEIVVEAGEARGSSERKSSISNA
jgi:hypothetical protein